jgi:hypothetical protein
MAGAVLAATLTLPPAVFAGTTDPEAQQDKGSGTLGMNAERPMTGGSLGHGLMIQEQNGISYVSGGIGDDQQNALARASNQFNLKLTMSMRDGKYVGGGDVRIADASGKSVLETRANGPLFLAKLPPGKYKVHVNTEGQAFTRDVTVSSSGQQQVSLTVPASSESEPIRAGDAPDTKPQPRNLPPADEPLDIDERSDLR